MIELTQDGSESRWAHIFYVDMEDDAKRDRAATEGLVSRRMVERSSKLTVAKIYPSIKSRVDGEEPLAVGVAACSKKDNFCKRLGRTIAIGRALKKLR